MNPSHALRLQTMLRSMIEVIVPALDPNQQLARDQAQILIGNLRLLADQAGRTYEYEMVELREFAALLRRMLAAAEGGTATTAAAARAAMLLDRIAPATALPVLREAEVSEFVVDARECADALVVASDRDGEKSFREVVIAAVLEQAAAQNLRERVWFKAAGIDAAPQNLPSLDDVLALESQQDGDSS